MINFKSVCGTSVPIGIIVDGRCNKKTHNCYYKNREIMSYCGVEMQKIGSTAEHK